MGKTTRLRLAMRIGRGLLLALGCMRAHAAEPTEPEAGPPAATPASASTNVDAPTTENWAVRGQATNVTQWHPPFHSPYSGTNSLVANGRTEETTDATLYLGLRLGPGTELWLNPEIDQGFGLSDTVGVAGFPSGEAYKVGQNSPYLRLPRAFVRQTISLGQGDHAVAGSANQLAGTNAADNIVLTLGKFSVTDIFDTNSYAHDPRSDFLNWSIIDAGPFDYAADAWGFTYGGAAEWSVGPWTWRGGLFQLSPIPNGKINAVDFSQYMVVAEAERRYEWQGLAGKVKLLGFVNRGRMGAYDDAVRLGQSTSAVPDTSLVRRYGSRPGGALNIEQAVTADIGSFARLGVNSGSKEAYEFTEINNSVSGGVSIKGSAWRRANDVIGVALVTNGLSAAARSYFAAGGIGILIGDGRLNYGREQIAETYYALQLGPHFSLAFDAQRVVNPAYNRDRGPVTVLAVRTHAEF